MDKPIQTREVDKDGCHISATRIGADLYVTSVSYQAHNTRGEHVASPQWEHVGSRKSSEEFIAREVERAQKFVR